MHYLKLILIVILAVAIPVWAQDAQEPQAAPADAPATDAAEPAEPAQGSEAGEATEMTDAEAPADEAEPAEPAEALTAVVVSVEGAAEHAMADVDEPVWEALTAGEELGEQTLIRTGLGATVVLKFADRGDVVIRGATKCGIASFRKAEDTEKVTVRMGLKYGSLNAKVDASAGKNDFQVATPVGTLAAKGSQVSVGFSSLGLGVNGQAGLWTMNGQQGNSQVGPGQQTDGQGTPDNQMAAGGRSTDTGDPFGQGGDEYWNLINNGGGRGVFDFTGSWQGGTVGGNSVGPACPPAPPAPPTPDPTPPPSEDHNGDNYLSGYERDV